jgi:hypothetical protein
VSKHNYSFAYYTKDNDDLDGSFAIDDNVMRNLAYGDNVTWPVVLRDFINFLSGIYGYDIGESVEFDTIDEKLAKLREERPEVFADDDQEW